MNYIIACMLFVVTMINQYFSSGTISPEQVFILVSGLCLVFLAYRLEKYKSVLLAALAILLMMSYYDPIFTLMAFSGLLVSLPMIYLWVYGIFLGIISVMLGNIWIITIIPVMILLNHFKRSFDSTKEQLTNQLDYERALRYDLEKVKDELLLSQQEIINLTKSHERNRIARDIHDKVGHQLTGTMLALEAAIMMEDQTLKEEFLNKSYKQLSQGLEMIRDTVHDISSDDDTGFSSIIEIVSNFEFCDIAYDYNGDVNSIPTHVMVVLIMNLKEALTNIIRYSKASSVKLSIDVTDTFIRMSISDNGKGSDDVKEGLGLSNMRQRLLGVSGILSYHSDNGFHVVNYIKKV